MLWACSIALLLPLSPRTPSGAPFRAEPARLKWWLDAKFGIFIHWGPASLTGKEISWSRGRGVPVEVYDSLYKRFNPTKFDAEKWASLFKAAGAKYVVFVTKHHDGFCMFDSALTDYDIMSTPFGRDITGELVRACRKAGLKILFYYSLCDWHHPQYVSERKPAPPGRKADFGKYLRYMFGQIRELCEKYEPDGFWFDGGWEHSPEEWRSKELIRMIRSILPGAIVNNRARYDGDFDTPEQHVGPFRVDRP